MFSLLAKKVGAIAAVGDTPGTRIVVPSDLPLLQAQSGADLAKFGGFARTPGSPAPESLSPAEFLSSALNERKEALPVTKAIAQALPEKESVQWAVVSANSVSPKLSVADRSALERAEQYLKTPSPATQRAAAAAAANTDFQGPGAWAAQAASLVGSAPTVTPGRSPLADCVAGAVALAAGLSTKKSPVPPALIATIPGASSPAAPTSVAAAPANPSGSDMARLAEALKPFIESGLKIASRRI
jgi:hypothetical protein